ncbi:hypothetical protein BV22DRAFT_226996 [Leucogyrophana mollusca]|uniref:Uncharacterized protein n=1 Tax=Leucogyrophana mollusca TaxID=85980 RepID=A0ACB8BRL3_9AGAM|nr:hypothetical protein BV22DRAFT_226996 [Leucogyrophana mollusca]
MAVFAHSRHHWAYVWIPVFAAFMWFSTLLAMLVTWLATGRPQYASQQGKIAYISDVGASYLKPLFVVTCCITGVSFFLSLVIERFLRHSGRLLPNMRKRERVLSSLAIFGSFIGMWGLVLLSGFDTKRYPSAHRFFLLLFMLGVAISALFTILEYRWLAHDFADVRQLKRAYLAKAIIAGALIACAVAFGVALYYAQEVGAILEWVISFGYTLYLLTFYYDLRMAKGVHKGQLNKEALIENGVVAASYDGIAPASTTGAGAGTTHNVGTGRSAVPQNPHDHAAPAPYTTSTNTNGPPPTTTTTPALPTGQIGPQPMRFGNAPHPVQGRR